MSSPEVEWTIEQLGSVVADTVDPLRRVNRDESILYDGSGDVPDMAAPIHERSGKLEAANYVGVHFVDRAPTAIGTEYDHSIETVVSLRVEGLDHSEYGHVDPNGVDGIAWGDLVRNIRRTLLASRTWPDAGDAHTTYTDLQFANEADTSSDWKDFCRYDADLIFSGYEDLP